VGADSSRTAECDLAEIKEQAARILESPIFVRAPRMRHFLAFLVEETLAGRACQLKEYTIATGVFGKPADFEPGTSSLVRVEAGRLRRLLMQYRVEHGEADAIVLEVPKGTYVPTFRRVSRQAGSTHPESAQRPEAGEAASAALESRSWGSPEERRLVTVVSCAFANERGASHGGGPAEFLDAFDVFHEKCTSIAHLHGGTVDGGASDRLIVYFGWPQALEDAAGRALTAALEMLAAIRQAFGAGSAGVRIGVATSEVVIRASTGTASAGAASTRPAVIGEAPSLATQILPKVPLNGVLVAECSRRLTGSSFDFVPAGSLDGGSGTSGLLWRLIRAKPALTRYHAAHTGQQFPIIGRREEEALLMSRWRLSLQGEGQAAIIVGDAGIGKSRLAESVLERIGTDGAQLRLQCSPHHTNSTLYPCIELIKSQISDGTTEEAPLGRRLRPFCVRFQLTEPLDQALLGTLLSGTADAALSPLSASQRKDLTLELLARLLRTQVSRRPTVLLVEDTHWADPTTVELLQHVLRRVGDIQLFVLLTSRQDAPPDLAQRANLTSIRLTRLPRKECNELIDRMLSAAPLSSGARAAILDKAEGVPLFLEELTKLFLATDGSGSRDSPVPESLSDLLASQLDKLGSTRGIAQAAAVIGRQFTRTMLAQACGCPEEETDTALDQLVAAGVIVREGSDGSHAFAFRHALLRDAAYNSMLAPARRELHLKVARLLLDSFADFAGDHPEVIASHLVEAGCHEEAVPFWISAGRKAAGRYALAEAAADLRVALKGCAHSPESRANAERELEALIDLGWVIRHARGYGDGELASIYRRVRLLATELGKAQQLANAIYGLWTHAAGRGEWKTALSLAGEFERLSRDMGDSQLEVEAFRLLGASAAFTGEFSVARAHFEHALSVYDSRIHGPRFGFDPGAASAAYMSWTLWHLGQREQARACATRALAIAEATNHASTLAMVLSWLIFYEICEENVDVVLAYNDRLQKVCAERDCRYWQPFGAACAEWALFERDGDARHLERLLESAGHFRERYLTSCLLLLAARLCGRLGRPEQGLEIAATAQKFIEEHDERVWEAECSRVMADLLLQSSTPTRGRARQLLLRAIQTAEAQEACTLAQRAAASLEELDSRAT
jgi:class 3 adenylate cyclase/ABC-type transport system involved in cytochrome c biogenesis ATPase subunit